MMDAIAMLALYLGAKGLTERKGATVPEPEFVRFQLSRRRVASVRAAGLAPANTPAYGPGITKPSTLPGVEAGDLAA